MKSKFRKYHRFLDEAGDTTFYSNGKIPIVGLQGVSKAFMIGMVEFNQPLNDVRNKIINLKEKILNNEYLKPIPSIKKKVINNNYYFHATDDPPEVRMILFEFIRKIDCNFDIVVARKNPAIFEKIHNNNSEQFYADLLSHLIMFKLTDLPNIILNVAEKGKSTYLRNLENATKIAESKCNKFNTDIKLSGKINYNVQNHIQEPLLNIADYFCWSVQRVFERGETRYYDYLSDKIRFIVDLYDAANFKNKGNYYSPLRKLTEDNLIK